MEEAAPPPIEPAKTITFRAFLETVPPSSPRSISDLFEPPSGAAPQELNTPQLLLHCDSDICHGERLHRRTGSAPQFVRPGARSLFVEYLCSNCRMRKKIFSLEVIFADRGDEQGEAYKFGEQPPFGPATPTRLLKLLGDQKGIFLKGRRCETQGLGVGAFAYYRRVVESQRNRILDEIIKVSQKLDAPASTLELLGSAKAENQFSKSIAIVKDAIPQALLINGHNPLTLLHTALSSGLHEQSDERCLELAHDVRVVMADLSERLGQALKDEVELNAAVGRLLRAKES